MSSRRRRGRGDDSDEDDTPESKFSFDRLQAERKARSVTFLQSVYPNLKAADSDESDISDDEGANTHASLPPVSRPFSASSASSIRGAPAATASAPRSRQSRFGGADSSSPPIGSTASAAPESGSPSATGSRSPGGALVTPGSSKRERGSARVAAAVRIQAIVRGWLARRTYAQLLAEDMEREESAQRETRAAQVAEGYALMGREETRRALEQAQLVASNRAGTALYNASLAPSTRHLPLQSPHADNTPSSSTYAVTHTTGSTSTSDSLHAQSDERGGADHVASTSAGGDVASTTARLHAMYVGADDGSGTGSSGTGSGSSGVSHSGPLPPLTIHATQQLTRLPSGYRTPEVASLASQPLLPPGHRLPSDMLASLPQPPARANKRSAGALAPKLSSAKMRSRARAPGETNTVVVVAGHKYAGGGGEGGGLPPGTVTTVGDVTTVVTFPEAVLLTMPLPQLLELRERLRDLLNDVNEDLTTALLIGDEQAQERNRLKRRIAEHSERATATATGSSSIKPGASSSGSVKVGSGVSAVSAGGSSSNLSAGRVAAVTGITSPSPSSNSAASHGSSGSAFSGARSDNVLPNSSSAVSGSSSTMRPLTPSPTHATVQATATATSTAASNSTAASGGSSGGDGAEAHARGTGAEDTEDMDGVARSASSSSGHGAPPHGFNTGGSNGAVAVQPPTQAATAGASGFSRLFGRGIARSPMPPTTATTATAASTSADGSAATGSGGDASGLSRSSSGKGGGLFSRAPRSPKASATEASGGSGSGGAGTPARRGWMFGKTE